jgi:polyhydroxybutyrate depolymerase
MKYVIYIFLLGMFFNVNGQTNVNGSISIDGNELLYRLFIPSAYDESLATPLVISMHGFGGNGVGQQNYDGLSFVADTAGFLVVYPTAFNNTWNAGEDYYSDYTSFNDVAFISQLIDSISLLYNIDLTRVYACGMSNGGDMAYRLACELSDRIAAVGSVTGTMITDIYASCAPEYPMPVIHFHGTGDDISSISGGPGWVSLKQTIGLWRTINNCSDKMINIVPNTDPEDNTTARLFSFDCPEARLDYYIIKNGGHTWPGTPYDFFSVFAFGYTSGDIAGSAELWRFFSEFTRESPSTIGRQALTVEYDSDSVLLWPNPVTSELNISYHASSSSEGLLSVCNLSGQTLKEIPTHILHGLNSWQLPLEGLSHGIYVVKVQAASAQYVRTFIKQ